MAHPKVSDPLLLKELIGKRKRYRIVDQPQLLSCLAMDGLDTFRCWYQATLQEKCGETVFAREGFWSSAFAVGEPAWLKELGGGLDEVTQYTRPADSDATDSSDTHVLKVPQSLYLRLWDRIGGHER